MSEKLEGYRNDQQPQTDGKPDRQESALTQPEGPIEAQGCQPSSQQSVRSLALAAKEASAALATTSTQARNAALHAMADALRKGSGTIKEANRCDVGLAREKGMAESLIDRLVLDDSRIEAMAAALEELAALLDPLGMVQEQRTLPNGMELKRISVPLGLVAMVYEARPNVTADAAGIALKAGNAVILRGGSAAAGSNAVISALLHDAAVGTGMPKNCICAIASTDRSATDELMGLHGIVDVLIPRGGEGLIRHCIEHSKVPVIETGTGNCHVYVESSADLTMAQDILVNAKCRRTGVCNAAETLLVDEACAEAFLPRAMDALAKRGILMHADGSACRIATACGIEGVVAATEADWATEYLAPEIAIRCLPGIDEAIAHINRFGTQHSEAIVTQDEAAADRFCKEVDAAAVYVNASTAFTDGGQFGMGAEIGISTQKLHVRGPFALAALTSYKYVLRGTGQVRAS
ncbi:MAG: glutamate-5-semialdehyde dehydrogenase [Coriobacteriaceae bacterium]|jgi:glutamate-5-semialdehyde dehydrogenase|nr:glutamate-5-semialdehyde dehydrogenase [Coriobacteriaceae bacterium]